MGKKGPLKYYIYHRIISIMIQELNYRKVHVNLTKSNSTFSDFDIVSQINLSCVEIYIMCIENFIIPVD